MDVAIRAHAGEAAAATKDSVAPPCPEQEQLLPFLDTLVAPGA